MIARYCKAGLLLLVISVGMEVYAQGGKGVKWGVLSKSERELTRVPYDTAANAVVLSDRAYYDVNFANGCNMVIHRRIKILKESGMSNATMRSYYTSKDGLETVMSIRAQTLNAAADGQVVATPVASDQMYTVKNSSSTSSLSFTFPAVKVGSVVEYEIRVNKRNHLFLDTWYFQAEIPTLYSAITLSHGRSFDYSIVKYGNKLVPKYRNKSDMTWELSNLEALKFDDYLPNPYDYAERIMFQLSSSTEYMPEMDTWDEVTTKLVDDYISNGYFKDRSAETGILELPLPDSKDTLSIIKHVHAFVADKYAWNGVAGIIPSDPCDVLLATKKGNSVAKNLLLLNLLRRYGIDADIVLLSTRNHGAVYKKRPMLDQLNYLVVAATVGGKTLILDAKTSKQPFDLLDNQLVGVEGYRIHNRTGEWIAVQPYTPTAVAVVNTMKQTATHFEGVLRIASTGYYAKQYQDMVKQADKMGISNKLFDAKSGMHIDSVWVEKGASITTSNTVNVAYRYPYESQSEHIYMESTLLPCYKANPFVNTSREMPVVLSYLFGYTYQARISLLPGYTAEVDTQDVNEQLGSKCSFISINRVTNNGHDVSIYSDLSFRSTFFPGTDYPLLRQLVDKVVNRDAKPLVITKTGAS